MDHNQPTSRDRNPIGLLVAASALTVVVLAWVGWSVYDNNLIAHMTEQRNERIAFLRSRILHLDEVLTMSARMGAATGDLRWEQRYRTFERELDDVINQAMAIQHRDGRDASHRVALTNAANVALVEMENKAFSLVHAGRLNEAKALLSSDEYGQHKIAYAQGMAELDSHLKQISVATSQARKSHTVSLMAAVVLVLLVTVGVWYLIIRMVRKWQARLVESNCHLITQGIELTNLNATLDQRVQNQTEELRETKDYTDNIIGSMIDMLVVVAPDGNIVRVNQATCRLLGYREDQLIGQPASLLLCDEQEEIYDVTHRIQSQDAIPLGRHSMRRLTTEGSVGNIENLFRAKSGDEIPVLVSGSVMRGNDGQARGIVFVAQDITERKRVEDALQENELKYRTLVELSPLCIHQINAEGQFMSMNRAGLQMINENDEQAILGVPYLSCVHEHDRDRISRLMDAAFDGESSEFEFRNTGDKEYSSSFIPIYDANAKVDRLLGITQDITERTKAQAAMKESQKQAETANQSKSEFLANMSHEIRTPMTAILGFADILLERGNIKDAPPERIEAVQTIKKNGKHLLGIINDILDLSKVEAGKMGVENIASNPCKLIAEVAALVKVKADSKNISFDIEYIGAVPETIQTDPTRLRQILINLIGNAIKFTEIGSVRLITRFVEDKDQPAMWFDVLDTGIGMTEQQVAKLFQPFTQADASTTRKFGGTGLGLTISKRFAQMLGGNIAVVDTLENTGTRFRLTVSTGTVDQAKMIEDPLSATVIATENTTGSADLPDLQNCRILLAEDGPDNQRLITHFLNKAGAQVTVKENGKLAVDAALAARDEGHSFDVILMDMQMPVMAGYEAASLLRQHGYTGTIIARTAHAMASGRTVCIDAGCDDYATKPINRKKLIETIHQHLVLAADATPVAT